MRQRLVVDIDGTLTYGPPEGVPTAGTVSIQLATGADLPTPVADAAATVTDTGLSYALAGAQVATKGLYRAVWTYTVAAVEYVRDELFSVVARLLSPTAKVADLAPYLPQEMARLVKTSSDGDAMLAAAWDEVLDDLESRGIEPDRVMDSDRLRIPHIYRTLALWSQQKWGPRWADWSLVQQRTYVERLEGVLSGPTSWLDQNDDLKQQPGERLLFTVTLTR